MSNEQTQEAIRLLKKIVRMHEGRATAINVPTLAEMKEIADFLNKETPKPVMEPLGRILNGDEFYYRLNPSIVYHVIKVGGKFILEMKTRDGFIYEGTLWSNDNIGFCYHKTEFRNEIHNVVRYMDIEFINQ